MDIAAASTTVPRAQSRRCPNTTHRKIARQVNESHATRPASWHQHLDTHDRGDIEKKVEMLFAHLKRILRLDRCGFGA